jgi:hypothetical protein
MATYRRIFKIPVDNLSSEKAENAISELISEYKENIWFPERVPDLLSNELNVDNELLQNLVDEWKKHFINDSTGTINEYISQEIIRFKNSNVGATGVLGVSGLSGVNGDIGVSGSCSW